jgi:hypothetical protein
MIERAATLAVADTAAAISGVTSWDAPDPV